MREVVDRMKGYKWTIAYIAVLVTVSTILQILDAARKG